jgi:alanyl-tRNA synthetase
VTDEELHQVEDFVNARIQEQLPLIERRDILLHRR